MNYKGGNKMALIKSKVMDDGTTCEYHTPVIIQNNRKVTTIAVSSFKDKAAYLAGKSPIRSRVDGVILDSKYPTVEKIYAKLKESRMSTPKEGEEAIETNWYADAEDDI